MSCRTSHNQPVQRELFLKYQVDDSSKVTLAAYAYDNLGRLQSKSLHGSAVNEIHALVNYAEIVVIYAIYALSLAVYWNINYAEFVLTTEIS